VAKERKVLSDEERAYWRRRVNEQFADSISREEWEEMGRHRGWLPVPQPSVLDEGHCVDCDSHHPVDLPCEDE
jgi:hypothetical protein